MRNHKQPFMDIHVNNLTLQEAADAIERFIVEKHKAYVVEVNTDVMIKIEEDPYLRQITNEADLVLIDGQPLEQNFAHWLQCGHFSHTLSCGDSMFSPPILARHARKGPGIA